MGSIKIQILSHRLNVVTIYPLTLQEEQYSVIKNKTYLYNLFLVFVWFAEKKPDNRFHCSREYRNQSYTGKYTILVAVAQQTCRTVIFFLQSMSCCIEHNFCLHSASCTAIHFWHICSSLILYFQYVLSWSPSAPLPLQLSCCYDML